MANREYDYLIVGSGLFGAVFAHESSKNGKKCLVIDKRSHVGGNVYTKKVENINVHCYGPHIFHTNNEKIWKYVNSLVEFNRFTYSPIANYMGKYFNLPFNMNTFYQLWMTRTPEDAKKKLKEQTKKYAKIEPTNLEEQALSLVGEDIYYKLIKGYSEKQWGVKATKIPAFIIKRLPLRFTYDNNYYNDKFQGIPIGGYTKLVNKLLSNIVVKSNCNYFDDKNRFDGLTKKIVFTGKIDEYFDYKFGSLDYRSLQFEHEHIEMKNYQGNAAINYTDSTPSYTRVIEHKHFEFGRQETTVVTREYPRIGYGNEPYYPISDQRNNAIYKKYAELSKKKTNVIFGGRLAEYKYYDMHQVIASALKKAEIENTK